MHIWDKRLLTSTFIAAFYLLFVRFWIDNFLPLETYSKLNDIIVLIAYVVFYASIAAIILKYAINRKRVSNNVIITKSTPNNVTIVNDLDNSLLIVLLCITFFLAFISHFHPIPFIYVMSRPYFILSAIGYILFYVSLLALAIRFALKKWKQVTSKQPPPPPPNLGSLATIKNAFSNENLYVLEAVDKYYFIPSLYKLTYDEDKKPIEIYSTIDNNTSIGDVVLKIRFEGVWTDIDNFFFYRDQTKKAFKLDTILTLCKEEEIRIKKNDFHTEPENISVDLEENKYFIVTVNYKYDGSRDFIKNVLLDLAIIKGGIGLNLDLIVGTNNPYGKNYEPSLKCQLSNIHLTNISSVFSNNSIKLLNLSDHTIKLSSFFLFEQPLSSNSWYLDSQLTVPDIIKPKAEKFYDWVNIANTLKSLKTVRPDFDVNNIKDILPNYEVIDVLDQAITNETYVPINSENFYLTVIFQFAYKKIEKEIVLLSLNAKINTTDFFQKIDIKITDGKLNLKDDQYLMRFPMTMLVYTDPNDIVVDYFVDEISNKGNKFEKVPSTLIPLKDSSIINVAL